MISLLWMVVLALMLSLLLLYADVDELRSELRSQLAEIKGQLSRNTCDNSPRAPADYLPDAHT